MGTTSMSPAGIRETALMNFYSAERRAGATVIEANERLHFYAKRLDELFERQQAAVTTEMKRVA